MPFSYGVTPKDYLRILQLQRVLWASRTGMNWAQAALDAGYYDQAYMIAEFREFIGLASSTPYFNVRTWTASFGPPSVLSIPMSTVGQSSVGTVPTQFLVRYSHWQGWNPCAV